MKAIPLVFSLLCVSGCDSLDEVLPGPEETSAETSDEASGSGLDASEDESEQSESEESESATPEVGSAESTQDESIEETTEASETSETSEEGETTTEATSSGGNCDPWHPGCAGERPEDTSTDTDEETETPDPQEAYLCYRECFEDSGLGDADIFDHCGLPDYCETRRCTWRVWKRLGDAVIGCGDECGFSGHDYPREVCRRDCAYNLNPCLRTDLSCTQMEANNCSLAQNNCMSHCLSG